MKKTKKCIYYVGFELFIERQINHNDLISSLVKIILTHGPDLLIKPYSKHDQANDIPSEMKISEQCWNKKRFKSYFHDIWDTSERAKSNKGSFIFYGKVFIKSKIE